MLLWRCSNLLLLSLLRRLGLSSGFQVSGSGFRDWNSRCRVHGLRFRACLLLLLLMGLRVEGRALRVEG